MKKQNQKQKKRNEWLKKVCDDFVRGIGREIFRILIKMPHPTEENLILSFAVAIFMLFFTYCVKKWINEIRQIIKKKKKEKEQHKRRSQNKNKNNPSKKVKPKKKGKKKGHSSKRNTRNK